MRIAAVIMVPLQAHKLGTIRSWLSSFIGFNLDISPSFTDLFRSLFPVLCVFVENLKAMQWPVTVFGQVS